MQLKEFKLILIAIIFCISTVSAFVQKVDTLAINQSFELIKSDTSIIVIDCRDSLSFKNGHLPRAIHLDVNDEAFEQKLQLFDKNKGYLIYCRTNGRSKNMTKQMLANGFTRIYLFEAGFLKWEESNYPIVK